MHDILYFVIIPILYLVPFEIMTVNLHKYVMHGFGWGWHESHHQNPGGGVEKNDLYAVCFAIISIGLFYLSTKVIHSDGLLAFAIGLTLYGAFYFFVHDILIHRRIPNQLFRKISHPYVKRLIRAHAIHHNVKTKEGAEAFGFLYAPKKYAFPDLKTQTS